MVPETSPLLELTPDECVDRLLARAVGRIAFLAGDGGPLVLPVNYRYVRRNGPAWLVLRTRPGSKLGTTLEPRVAFEVDEIDSGNQLGWSVVVRGTLHHLHDDEIDALRSHFDPEPWVHEERDAWLIIKAAAMTGRRLVAPEGQWPFHPDAYL